MKKTLRDILHDLNKLCINGEIKMDNDSVFWYYNEDYIDYYTNDLLDSFNDGAYADNKGMYTYNLTDPVYSVLALGETPIYYMDNFNTLTLKSPTARIGDDFIVTISQFNDYLEEVYDFQYIYDSNTLVSNFDFDIEGADVQDITLDIFKGIGDGDGVVNYRLENSTDDYRNGSLEGDYNMFLSDSYTLKIPKNIDEHVESLLDRGSLNSVFGRMLVAMIFIIVVAIAVYLKSRNVIATLLTSFVIFGISFAIGLIPAWIILFVVMLLFIMVYFMFSRTSV